MNKGSVDLKGIVAGILLALGLAGAASAQVNNEAYRDYFLVGQFGEVCTMCEVVVLCAEGNNVPVLESVPGRATFTLYYIQTRTFWSQISTIWEWFIANFSSSNLAARGHTRPVWVYQIYQGEWAGPLEVEGRLILDPAVIELGGFSIERKEALWQEAGKTIGSCQRMPLWDSIEIIEANAAGVPE